MKIFKNSIVACLVLFAAGHLAFTLCYSLPEDLVPDFARKKSIAYCEPLFKQGWALFAPAPEVNKKIYISYLQNGGSWSGWEAAFDKYLFAYQSNRMSASAKIVLSLNSRLHYLHQSYKNEFAIRSNCIGNVSSGLYGILKFEALRELKYRNIETEEIRMLVVYKDAKCGAEKMYSIYFPESVVKK